MRKFNAMHSVRVRSPYEVKVYGDPDKPFVLEWDYPLWYKGRFSGTQRRHQLASAEKLAAQEAVLPMRSAPALGDKGGRDTVGGEQSKKD